MFDRSKLPILTVDACIFDTRGALLLVQRRYPPFEGQWALPGGLVDANETVEQAVIRELGEETGFSRHWQEDDHLKLLRLYSDPGRDPRGHYISAAFYGFVEPNIAVTGGDDAAAAEWHMGWRGMDLAFDHSKIARDCFAVLGIVMEFTDPHASQEELAQIKITPRQRSELKAIYQGKGGRAWRKSYDALAEKGLIKIQPLSTGGWFFIMTRKGMDFLTYKPEE